MAPADSLSPPGSSSYSSDTLTVGDGTWDFTKNTFLLPNLVGLNFETMRYNGMGNRFATLTEYHSLILGHGVLAAITFLFIVPIAVLLARFYTRQPGNAVRYHAYLQILAVGLSTVIFVLGFIAVGPPRNLTNPHHGIGVAIYVLILLQAFGGRLVSKLTGRSFRLHVHRWSGRAITILGIVQVPLGLTLYGSPKHLFILYAVWMGFLLVLYFILDYRDYGRRDFNRGRAHSSHVGAGDESSRVTEKSGGGMMKWLGPLAAGAGALALLKGRKKNKDTERGMSRSPSPVGRPHRATVISSRRESDSYYDEKHPDQRRVSRVSGGDGGGGFMNKIFGAGAGLGAAALVAKMMNRGDRRHDDEYSAVATDTPSRVRRHPPPRSEFTESEYTDFTEDTRRYPSRRDADSSILPAPRPHAGGGRPPRPMTPQRSHAATSRFDSTIDGSDYSSYVSPSRRTSEPPRKNSGAGKGLLAGMGLGFLAKMGKDKRDRDRREEERLRDEEDRRREEEEDRRAGRRNSKYTGDGYPTPTRQGSRRRPPRPPPSGVTMTETVTSVFSDESSIEPRGSTPYDPAPPGMRPPPPGPTQVSGAPPVPGAYGGPPPAPRPAPIPVAGTIPGQPPRYDPGDITDPVSMPPMPADPHGFFHRESDGSEAYNSTAPGRSRSSRRRREREVDPAIAAANASASALALEEEERRRRGERAHQSPVSVHLSMADNNPGRFTLRRLPEGEAVAHPGGGSSGRHRRRADSVSSESGNDTPTAGSAGRRYRRDHGRSSSRGRAETAAEQRVEAGNTTGASADELDPPNPAFARRAGGKDSAYYSGGAAGAAAGGSGGGGGAGAGAGPSGAVPAAEATISTLDSPAGLMSPGGSHATFTSVPMTDAGAAADRRRRRRLERRDGSRQPSVDYT
ncbi:uncharacterized protein B0H64DRAFT_151712 [Chaetomium fimeti]|uniref:Cytochrome b561 domain-containing protein n=1 Tax=Chaetomium fimeti TaxID=1854472 RepID=A0AAE0LRZ5_9PEZI|nr:hypothetical protein B0H64DRAFT_151712 [Chaetomium fimeti]